MPDIFISYKKEERAVASELATRLTEAGYDVWWDDALLAGERYEDEIASVIDQSGAVVVLWSRQSIKSEWVRAEADAARQQKKAFPVIIDDMSPTQMPLMYRGMHAARFEGWKGELDHEGYVELIGSIEDRIGKGRGPRLSENEAEARLAETATENVRTIVEATRPAARAERTPLKPIPPRRMLPLIIAVVAAIVVLAGIVSYWQYTQFSAGDAANLRCISWSQSAALDPYSGLPRFDAEALGPCAAAAEARPNDGDALGRLAMLRIVQGTAVNDALALANRGIERGGAAAYYAMGAMYERGINLQRDYVRAGASYKSAHDLGYARATGALCLLAIDSGGTIAGMFATPADALGWCQTAAGKGDALGSIGAAYAMETGFGGQPVDPAGAAAIYQQLLPLGSDEAAVRLGILYHRGSGVQQDTAKAVELYRQAAGNNDPAGLRSLAISYELGEGVAPDPFEASRLYERAVSRRDVAATLLAGYAFDQNVYLTARVARDLDLLSSSPTGATSQRLRAALYARGLFRNMDVAAAERELIACADGGNLLCKVALGNFYGFGINGTRNPARAVPLYREAAEAGEMYGQYWYANALDWAFGVTQDQTTAIFYYRRAATQGHLLSQQRLTQLGQTF